MIGGMLLVRLALRIAGLALVAVGGGNALVPALHEATVTSTHWLDDAGFAEAVGIAQAAPGPNVLVIALIGWQIAGLPGALVALTAFLVPSAAVAVNGARWLAQRSSDATIVALRWALRPVTAGLMIAAAVVLAGTAIRAWPGSADARWLGALALGIAAGSARWRLHPLAWVAVAAAAGALLAGA